MLALTLGACGQRPAEEPQPGPPQGATGTPEWGQAEQPSASDPEPSSSDAPEISRSLGTVGGAVVLWPRIVLPHGSPAPDEETKRIAAAVQQRAASVARRVFKQVEVRPEPERVCPKTGCQGVSIGILLARAGGGCSVVAMVSPPGPSPAQLVPWSPGVVKLNAPTVRFREHAENVVRVKDYARCEDLPADLAAKDANLEAAMRAVPGH
jgi:hypothetical protein